MPVKSFNRKLSRTYNERIRGRRERRANSKEKKDNEEPINHSGNSYVAADFLMRALTNGGFVDGAELREELSQYIGLQGGLTPPLNHVKQKLPDYMFSIVTRMPYFDEVLRDYIKLQESKLADDNSY